MNKLLLVLLTFLLVITSVSAYPFNFEWDSRSPSSLQLGQNNIPISGITFTCQDSGRLTLCGSTQPQDTLQAPHGDNIWSCTPTRLGVAGGSCAGIPLQQSCSAVKVNPIDNSCWTSSFGGNVLQYNTPKNIFPFVTSSYTSNIEYGSLDASNTGILNDYKMQIITDVDVVDGLRLALQISNRTTKGQSLTITYTDDIADNLDGYIEVNQITNLYLFSLKPHIANINITFMKGNHQIQYDLNDYYGQKSIAVTPVINIRQVRNNTVLSQQTIAGQEVVASTNTVQQLGIANTVPYIKQPSTILNPSTNWFTSLWNWFKGLF